MASWDPEHTSHHACFSDSVPSCKMDTFIFVLGLKGLTWTWTGQLVTDPFNTTFFASLAAEIPLKYLRKISEGEWFVILPRESNVLFNWRCHPVCHMSRQKLTPADNSPVGAGGWVAVPTSGWVSDCQQQWWWTTLFPYGTPHISFAETPLTKKKRTFFFKKKYNHCGAKCNQYLSRLL